MSGYGRNKLTPAWRYRSSGVVWRIVPTASGKLIGETRDVQKKLVSFFCLNLRTGEVLWDEVRFGEPWWVGIEALYNDTLLLHKYATPDLPEHRALIAVDVLTGTELWRNEEVKFQHLGREGIEAIRTQSLGMERVQLDYRTGELLGQKEPRQSQLEVLESAQQMIELPTPLYDLEEDDRMSILLRRHCDTEKIVFPLDVLELDSLVAWNYHERVSAPTDEPLCMRNILMVADTGSGDLLFREVINAQAWVVVPDAFFLCERMLIYIHERATLTAIDVNKQ